MRLAARHAHATRPQMAMRIRGGAQFPMLAGLGDDSSGDGADVTGLQTLPDSSGSLFPITPTFDQLPPTVDTGSSGSSPSTLQQIVGGIALDSSSVAKAINASRGPYVIPGTSLVYNPATGQLAGQSAVGTATASAIGSFASMIPIIAVVVLGGFLLESMGGRK